MRPHLPATTGPRFELRRFTADAPGERLDRFLARACPDLSRSRVQDLIRDGRVRVDGVVVPKPAHRLRGGEAVEVEVIPSPPLEVVPTPLPLKVLYEDIDLLVIDKPAGLVVHPGAGHHTDTLANALVAYLGRAPTPDERPGIVHRLDKDTSGLMVAAKNEAAHRRLQADLKARRFKKGYIALVKGRLSPAEGVIDAPVGRDPRRRTRMAVVAGGRPAVTRFRVLEYLPGATLVEVWPETGRTHQIRVHFASLGHPLVGDGVYGRPCPTLNRHFLHAFYLGFPHPRTGRWLEFKSHLPPELEAELARRRASRSPSDPGLGGSSAV